MLQPLLPARRDRARLLGIVFTALAGFSSPVLARDPAPPVVHLAIRPDGRDGVGTAGDPRDASTAGKLDALWPNLPAGAEIRFSAGAFQTVSGLLLKDGQRIVGQGPRKTILKLADGAVPAAVYSAEAPLVRTLLRSQTLDGNNHVRGLRLDGNRDKQPAYARQSPNVFLGAIAFYGMDCSVRDIHYVNGWSRAEGEAFPILIESHRGSAATPARGLIERVVVEEHDGYNTSISLLAQTRRTSPVIGTAATGVFTTPDPHGYAEGDEIIFIELQGGREIVEGRPYYVRSPTTNTFKVAASPGATTIKFQTDLASGKSIQPRRITGAIRDCRVIGRKQDGFSKSIAFGCGGWQGVEVSGNRAEDVGVGINTDSHCYRDVTIADNFFGIRANPAGSQGFGVFLGGGASWTNYLIRRNTFVLSANAAALVLNGNVRGTDFRDNVIRRDGPAAGVREAISIRYAGNSDLRVRDNLVDSGLTFRDAPGVTTINFGNRTPAGTVPPGWPSSRPARPVAAD